MQLEALATGHGDCSGYPLPLVRRAEGWGGDSQLRGVALREDLGRGAPAATMARRFHEALVDYGVQCATLAGLERVVLSGGCFQNLLLRERLTQRLSELGFSVYCAGAVPTNDGGISLGQAWVAANDGRSG
jgi:hydrogenase maturation protein HypF